MTTSIHPIHRGPSWVDVGTARGTRTARHGPTQDRHVQPRSPASGRPNVTLALSRASEEWPTVERDAGPRRADPDMRDMDVDVGVSDTSDTPPRSDPNSAPKQLLHVGEGSMSPWRAGWVPLAFGQNKQEKNTRERPNPPTSNVEPRRRTRRRCRHGGQVWSAAGAQGSVGAPQVCPGAKARKKRFSSSAGVY